ncbi:MAG: DUF3299 domain-containing protein, partial [Roseobacter sp.]|nr:DUF3299 domain-containing protein [Roseobacter sp.]
MRQYTVLGFLWAAVLCLLALVAPPAFAGAERVIQWDDLMPNAAAYDDPFLNLSAEQQADLQDVLTEDIARLEQRDDPVLEEAAQAARDRLSAAGLDVDVLLDQYFFGAQPSDAHASDVTTGLLGKDVTIYGYVLPLRWESGRVVAFFLVPWVGACIHTPPPPPNQIVYVEMPGGLALKHQFEPMNIKGELRHSLQSYDLFLIDGRQQVPAAYELAGAEVSSLAGDMTASSAARVDLPAFVRIQLWINALFTSGMTAIGDGGSTAAMLTALLLSFAYGALHTLGPGHGKAVVVSYFAGTGGSVRRGVVMGLRIAVFHVLSAIVVVFLFDFALRQTTGAAPADYRVIRLGSYALIVLIGAVMLWQALQVWRTGWMG